MELCDKEYGFLHLPSLIVFTDPYSRYDVVREFLREGKSSPEDLERIRPRLSSEAERDLIQRFTSLHHEIKHFHDLLLTPYGNRLIRSCFRYALKASLLLADGGWNPGADVDLPLKSRSTRTAEAVDRVYESRNECAKLIQVARLTLEAAAALAQRQLAWTQFGHRAFSALDADLSTDPTYSVLLDTLGPLLQRFVPIEDLAITLHRILIMSLGGGEAPDAFPRLLAQKLETATPDKFQQAIRAAWAVVEKNMADLDETNETFLTSVKQVHFDSPVIAEASCAAVADFCVKSRLLRSEFFRDQDSYLSLQKYNDSVMHFVAPLMYWYSVNDAYSLSTESLDLEAEDLASQVIFAKPGSPVQYYSHRLRPFEVKMHGATMDRMTWVRFARSTGGAVALMEEVDWLHPLNTLWLRTVEDLKKIRFRRDFPDQFAMRAGSKLP